MAIDIRAPGVYVFDVPATPPIAGVGTSTAGFLGTVDDGVAMPEKPDGSGPYELTPPNLPRLVTNLEQFARRFGALQDGNALLARSVEGFLRNGGTACYVVRLEGALDDVGAVQAGLKALEKIDEVAIVAAPGAVSVDVQREVVDHCVRLEDRFAVLDSQNVREIDADAIHGGFNRAERGFAAMYFPWLVVSDTLSDERGATVVVPPSGYVCGVYARVDATRGVHKAPANEALRGVSNLTYRVDKAEHGLLNPVGINVIRAFNGDLRVYGARTLGGDQNNEFKYVNVRRLINFIKESLDEGMQFAVFEPNALELWQRIKRSATNFLLGVWRDGALFGATQEQAFYVKCDEETNPPDVREAGRVVTEIGVAPVKPAEFVIFRISQFAEIPSA